MPTDTTNRNRSGFSGSQTGRPRTGNSDFIRVKKNFLYGLLIAVAALALLCLILMISTSAANKKVKKYKAVYGAVPNASDTVTDASADSTTVPSLTTVDPTGLSGVYTTLPDASDPAAATLPSATTGKAYIVTTNADTLNLRSEAGENAGIVGRIPKNTIVFITTESNGWGYTTYNGTAGWVKMAFLTLAASTTAPEATLTP
ncbi:MAG: SH3 domain-containing protein [Clostridia bacterium]|nr:SH3 domain-containing protein [Clostridia bacterium]